MKRESNSWDIGTFKLLVWNTIKSTRNCLKVNNAEYRNGDWWVLSWQHWVFPSCLNIAISIHFTTDTTPVTNWYQTAILINSKPKFACFFVFLLFIFFCNENINTLTASGLFLSNFVLFACIISTHNLWAKEVYLMQTVVKIIIIKLEKSWKDIYVQMNRIKSTAESNP